MTDARLTLDTIDSGSAVIAAFIRNWNAALDNNDRDRLLLPLIPRLVGTASTAAVEDRRAWMCLDWLVRTWTPVWLRLAGLDEQAAKLAGLPEVTALDVPAVRSVLAGVRRAAWAAAGDVSDAGDPDWVAVDYATRAAAGAAAWAAAGDVTDAGDAAWHAAVDAAGVAAMEAAWAGEAVRSALRPAVAGLQDSAVALIDRMIGCA